MPYDVPAALLPQLWKVKVLDREVPREEPHVTIIFKKWMWRYGIRTSEFLDEVPSPRDVPTAVLDAIANDHTNIVAAWNLRYPNNPV